jgi:nitrate reductase gamma subunit
MSALHNLMFVGLPYMAGIVFLVGTIYKFRAKSYKISSLSSQFLETKSLFWGSVPFHVGMMVVFFGHLFALLFPSTLLAWNSYPIRLILLEVTGYIFGLSFLFGIIMLIVRRLTSARVRAVTSWMDIVIELLLLLQVFLGCYIAFKYRWGSSWFASDMSPYLRSLFMFNPDIEAVKAMPAMIQAHVVVAYIILFIFPFTRLVHFLAAPFHYLFRPYQKVMWNWDRKAIRDSNTSWTKNQPRNN